MANRILLIFTCLFALSGCTATSIIAEQSTKYNLALEKNSNEVLLLNVIRASQRRPLYFTAFSKFSNTAGTVSSGLSFSFGPGSSSIYTLTPNINLNPNFDVAPLDTHEFVRGFLTPVPVETVDYYWRQGWPKQLLLTLFLERLGDSNKKCDIRGKFPDYKVKELECIQEQFHEFLFEETKLVGEMKYVPPKKIALGPSIDPKTSIETLKVFFELADTANLSVEEDKESSKLQLKKTTKEQRFIFCKTGKCESDGKELEAVLRSPEGIVYFLGEIVRVELEKGTKPPSVAICQDKQPASIFYVREATGDDTDPYVSVTYDGKRYVIPKLPNDSDDCLGQRTMQVLTLVAQLVQMQKSGKDLPTTATVRLIGQ